MKSPSEAPFSDVHLSCSSLRFVWDTSSLSSSDRLIRAQLNAHLSTQHTRSTLRCRAYNSDTSVMPLQYSKHMRVLTVRALPITAVHPQYMTPEYCQNSYIVFSHTSATPKHTNCICIHTYVDPTPLHFTSPYSRALPPDFTLGLLPTSCY